MRLLIFLTAVSMFCGCTLKTKISAIAPETATRDDRLLGSWNYEIEGEAGLCTISPAGADFPAGVCILKDAALPNDVSWFVTGKIGEVSYISMGRLADWNTDEDVIEIAPYEIVDGKFRVYCVEQDKFELLIRQGKIAGDRIGTSTQVTGSRADVRQLLKKYHKTIFSDTEFFELIKQ